MSQGNLSLSKEKIQIVLLEGVHARAEALLAEHGYENVKRPQGLTSRQSLIDTIGEAHMVGIRSRTQIDEEVLGHCRRLIALGCFCIGTNQVALSAAAKRGIPVFNAPHSNTRSVAELVIGLTVMLMRGIFEKSVAAHRGQWKKSTRFAHELRGKTLGIVGYGHIGSQVSVLAEALGMHVVYYDIISKLPLGNARAARTLSELLGEADLVTVHVPGGASTEHMIDAEALATMKPDSLLVNASRGKVVDPVALAEALRAEHLRGAAIDVYPEEPASTEEPLKSPLIGLDNVILTPHIGGSTLEAQHNIGQEVAAKLIAFSDRGDTEGAVNFPSVNLPSNRDAHRILHIHRNTPGILRQVNKAVSDSHINVLGQYLATTQDVGYVVLDIARGPSDELLKTLKSIDGTIRARILY